jgi:4-amino-4-deoxy-L-arabinose transferase-like glycosyltransferase/membrane-associated phospholipid phosphatase
MSGWLHSIDLRLFYLVNHSLSNRCFDRLMPFVSDSPWFACILFCISIFLLWKGGARGRICVLVLLLSVAIGNWLICDSIKHAVGRLRPFHVLTDAHLRVSMGDSYSFPSSHAANWFSAAMVMLIYFRRTVWLMVPMALLVGISRVYNGVHYPSDVVAGWLLGAGYSAAVVIMFDGLWRQVGGIWFPLWRKRLPSLLQPVILPGPTEPRDPAERDLHWVRLGYLLAGLLLLLRLAYLASGRLELSEDEAYQWIWSKHLALSYYSKPPLIAYVQFLGTHLWGNNEFGVRFFSPVITCVLSVMVLRFMAKSIGGRAAFFLLLILTATPLLSLGSIVMTIDPLSVLFWTAAMVAGWAAAQPNGTTRQWLWTGLWIGLGFLSKYTNLFQVVCWAVFFGLWGPARANLRRPGPWLALVVVVFCSLPVLIWNSQHNWVTVAHVASDGALGEKWSRIFTWDFLVMEAGVLNPVFFIGALWAALRFWPERKRDPWLLYLFSMGAPLFLLYLCVSLHSRVEYNWIAPSIIPLFCLMAVYWTRRWPKASWFAEPVLSFGIGVGLFAVIMAHSPNLLGKLIHRPAAGPLNVLRRAQGWKELANIVSATRKKIDVNGTPSFIVCEHYGLTAEISFYLADAKRQIQSDPIVYYIDTPKPENQFYYWPNYLVRTGQNALFVRELPRPRFRKDWFSRWLNGQSDLYESVMPDSPPVPVQLRQEFDSITNLGAREVVANGQIVRRVELIECKGLRAAKP